MLGMTLPQRTRARVQVAQFMGMALASCGHYIIICDQEITELPESVIYS